MRKSTDWHRGFIKRMICSILLILTLVNSTTFTFAKAKADEIPFAIGITTTGLNLRQEPTTESKVLYTFSKNTVLKIYEDLGEWFRVDSGFVFKQYVRLCDESIYYAIINQKYYYLNEFYVDNMVNLKNHYLIRLLGKCKAQGVTKKGLVNISGDIPCYDIIDNFAYFASGRNIYKVSIEFFSEVIPIGSDYEILDVYRTTFFDSSKSRKHNIQLVSSIINGTVVKSGKTFSYNKTSGPRDAANGYEIATVILNNEYVQDYGGGVCQVSSTIYSAIMHDNCLKVTSRKSHALEVSYLPIGMDATVSYGGTDLKFKNNYPFDIKINIYTDDGVCIVYIMRA